MKNLFIILILIISVSKVLSQTEIRPNIKKIAETIISNNSLDLSPFTGVLAMPTTNWDAGSYYKKHASNAELMYYVDNSNSVIRCYSYKALVSRKNSSCFSLLLKNLKNSNNVCGEEGGTGFCTLVGDYFLDVSDNILTSEQKVMIDSILIFDNKVKLFAKSKLLSEVIPNPKYYERIRKLAKYHSNLNAFIALSKFKNNRDVAIIKQLFRYRRVRLKDILFRRRYEEFKQEHDEFGIKCAIEFPHKSFYLCLVKMFRRDFNDGYVPNALLFQALAQYPLESTCKLFEYINLKNENYSNYQYEIFKDNLILAISKYPNKIFDELKEDIIKKESNDNKFKKE